MTDMATESILLSRKPMQSINHEILTILNKQHVPFIVPKALRVDLNLAAEAFAAKFYNKAAKNFKSALDSMSNIDEKCQDETIILTKYMLCMCWLESTDAKDLLEALKILEELERNHGCAYPMLYFAVGKTYFKLYRFNKAHDIIKKGYAILNSHIKLIEYRIPGTDVVIPESSRDRLVAALVTLNDQCSSWRRPDAVCCMVDCSSHSQNESADKNIFFGSPTFNGMVQVSCNNTSSICTVSFHTACWKTKKEKLCSLRKLSDKDLLHWECFTPNCEFQGERCTIKKIEIFDENAKVKASIEPRADDVVRHAKVQPPPPKGAIRKQQQQQQPKLKATTNESRTPVERHSRPSLIPHELHKVDETEDDDDLHDEQALTSGIEQLIELRARNFGINDEKIWRPNLSMYGNEFMLATAEVLPDPDFSNEGAEEGDLKAFFFSYFYTFISTSGPVKLDALTEKWHEAKNMIENGDFFFKHYTDITEFLLQSIKFAVVGGYICVAKKIPEAYDLAKTDACETHRFLMENDIAQRSDSSSVDDEAFFNDIVKPEKNTISLPYSSISGDSKAGIEDLNEIPDELTYTDKKNNEPSVGGPDTSKVDTLLKYATPTRKQKTLLEFGITAEVNGRSMGFVSTAAKPVIPHENFEKKKPIVSSQLVELPVAEVVTPIRKIAQKHPYSDDYVNGEVSDCIEKYMPTATRETSKSDDSLPKATNGVDHVPEIARKINVSAEEFTKVSKSANDVGMYKASPNKYDDALMSHFGEPDKRPNETTSPSPNSENGAGNLEKALDSRTGLEVQNEEGLVGELIEEVQWLSSKLLDSKGRTAQLESEVAQIKNAHAAERVKLLKKILRGQYHYNQSLIDRRLEECRKNYEIISLIQVILMTPIGSIVPVNCTEYQKGIAEIEKVSKNHQIKFWALNDKLESATEPEKMMEVNLQPDPMPYMPAIKLADVIQSALGVYTNHQMNGIQQMQVLQNPIAQQHHVYGSPLYRPHYNHNNPKIVYAPSFIPSRPQPPHVRISPLPHALPTQIVLVPPNPPPSTQPQYVPDSSQQKSSVRLQQPTTFAFGSTSSSACVQKSVYLPVDQSSSNSVRPRYCFPDASKVSQQPSIVSVPEHPKINPSQQQNRQNFEEPVSVSNQQGNVQSSEKSNGQFSAQQHDTLKDHSSAKTRSSPVPATCSDNSQDQFGMREVENVMSYDTSANPKTINESENNDYSSAQPKVTKARKKNYHSMDKLVQTLRSRYVGVLEFDLIKTVECVRKNHNNSLSGIPMSQIIRDAHKYIMHRQQKQLCDYEKRPSQHFTATNSSSRSSPNGECKRETSMSFTSFANSAKKEPRGSFATKKQWKPLVVPNDTWEKETLESECLICLETMLDTAKFRTLQCKHTFHNECIRYWLNIDKSCPKCRRHSTIDDEYPPLPLG